MNFSLYVWKIAGFFFTCIAGVFLHFLYDWSGQSPLIGRFSAVNESTWEHMKLLFFPMLVFAAIESRFLSDKYDNYWQSKLFGILYGTALIPVFYYLAIGILGTSPGWFNIVIFFLAVFGAHWLEVQIIRENRGTSVPPAAAIAVLAAFALLFMWFTFMPPGIPLFQAPQLP